MKKNYWFRLDCDFLSDPKIQDIHFALGNDAIVAYIVAVIRLYRNGGELHKSKYTQIAYEAHTSVDVVQKVIENYDLFLINGDLFSSARVIKELDSQREISEIRATAGKRGAQQRLANAQANAQANAMQNLSKDTSKNQANTITNTITNTVNINNPSSKDSGLCFPDDAENAQIFPENPKNEQETAPELSNKNCQQVVDFWNSTIANLGANYARVEMLSDARKKKIRIRWKEFARVGDPVEVCRTLFRKACASKFMQGDNRNGWSAGFDWLFTNDKNWLKVYEGNYDDKTASQQQHPKSHIDRMEEDIKYIHNFFSGNGTEQQQQYNEGSFDEQ